MHGISALLRTLWKLRSEALVAFATLNSLVQFFQFFEAHMPRHVRERRTILTFSEAGRRLFWRPGDNDDPMVWNIVKQGMSAVIDPFLGFAR